MITTRTVRCPKCFKVTWAFYPACPQCGRFMLLDYLFPVDDSKPGALDQNGNDQRRGGKKKR